MRIFQFANCKFTSDLFLDSGHADVARDFRMALGFPVSQQSKGSSTLLSAFNVRYPIHIQQFVISIVMFSTSIAFRLSNSTIIIYYLLLANILGFSKKQPLWVYFAFCRMVPPGCKLVQKKPISPWILEYYSCIYHKLELNHLHLNWTLSNGGPILYGIFSLFWWLNDHVP